MRLMLTFCRTSDRPGTKEESTVSLIYLHPSLRYPLHRRKESLYSGIDPSTYSATSQTGYKWGFAANTTRVDVAALQATREEVGAATYGRASQSQSGSGESGKRVHGPALPSASDLVLAREVAGESEARERGLKRRRERAEAKERVEDMVGPKEVGREGMMEKKRARREGDKAFREKGDDGMVETDEATLLGGGDSFKERCALCPVGCDTVADWLLQNCATRRGSEAFRGKAECRQGR